MSERARTEWMRVTRGMQEVAGDGYEAGVREMVGNEVWHGVGRDEWE